MTLKGRTTTVFGIWSTGLPRTFQVLTMTPFFMSLRGAEGDEAISANG